MSPLFAFVPATLLIDLAAKSIAVMVVACLGAILVSRASAAWRHLVWSLGIAALLLLPMLSIALPSWRVSWVPGWLAGDLLIAVRPSIKQITAISDKARGDAQHSAMPASDVSHAVVTDQPAAPALAGSSPAASRRGVAFNWTSFTAGAWFVGALVAIAPLGVGLWQLRRLRSGAVSVGDPAWLALLADARTQLRVRQQVRLEQSPQATMPLTWGVLWPVLLLPAEADRWQPDRRRMVLWHELAHIRRCDWLTQLMASAACAVYWFNPLVWLAARQMRTLRERACDDLVLACGAKASEYAQELLTLAAGLADPRLATLAAVPMARRSVLESRLRAILDSRQSRAALTTAVVLLATCLALAATAPLAMLRAAQPKPPKPEATTAQPPKAPSPAKPTEVSPRSPTAEEIEARASGIRISVLNSKGDKGIAEFRVIAGVPSNGIADEYEKRTGRTVVNWQPHTLRIGKDGDYVWPLAKAYDVMAIRVEADGYQPSVWPWAKKADGVQHIIFQLTEDHGIVGRVLTPGGKPAAGATVALALPQKEAVLEGDKLRGEGEPPPEKPGDRWRRPTMVKTDADGRFTLPTEFEPAAVLVVHELGVRELTYDDWKKSPEIKLDAWGQIDGRVLWKDKPGADEEVTLSIHRDEYGYPGMIRSSAATQTDKEGRFVFEKVLPGLVQISRPMKPADPTKSSFTAVNLDGLVTHAQIKAGQPTAVMIGGQGRTVSGKLAGLESYKGVTFHFHPTAPHIGFPGDDEIWKAWGELKASAIGPLLFRDKQPVKEDGTFVIENMLPGRYQLFVSAPGFTQYAASTSVEVKPEVPGEKPAKQELEVITIQKPAAGAGGAPAAGAGGAPGAAAAPAKPAKPAAEAPVKRQITIRGKAVDDETDKPIERLIVQAGMFDPADPTKVQWGFSETRSDAKDGSFSATIKWAERWTARIVADGYVPQPVVTAEPPAALGDNIELMIRLKRGKLVRGTVLDHTGKPVKGAAVFAIGPTLLYLSAGEAWSSWGEKDDKAKPVHTDDAGRFALPAGEATSVGVSHVSFDAWPAEIPAEGDFVIKLPQPARVQIELDIDGAAKDSEAFYQLLTEHSPGFGKLQSTRELPITNGGKLTLAALPPGKYQFCRYVMNRLPDMGMTGMLDREFIELKAGQTKTIRWVRDRGARLRGKVVLPAATEMSGVIISVNAEKAVKIPLDGHEWQTKYASLVVEGDGTFLTERIAPGTYIVKADGYKKQKADDPARLGSGLTVPSHGATLKVVVPAEGELKLEDLILKPVAPAPPF